MKPIKPINVLIEGCVLRFSQDDPCDDGRFVIRQGEDRSGDRGDVFVRLSRAVASPDTREAAQALLLKAVKPARSEDYASILSEYEQLTKDRSLPLEVLHNC